MNPVASVTAKELNEDPSARLWALVMHLAENPGKQSLPDFRHFWLAYIYDAQVNNGGHLQYFHNCGAASANETILALQTIGAMIQAELLEACLKKVHASPVDKVASLHEYSELAAERSFKEEDSAYYAQSPSVLELIEQYYQPLLLTCVETRG